MTQNVIGLRERKREATRLRIATEAARLATEHGVAGVTTEEIAAAAEVSRATFFRYFDAKETAIAEGFSGPRVVALLSILEAQPVDLGPLDAVEATFRELGSLLDRATAALVLEQARIVQQSPALQAWTASAYLRDEVLVAEVIARRLGGTPGDADVDVRSRMAGAVAMAAIRTALERWVASSGRADLNDLMCAAVRAVGSRDAR